MRRWGEGIREEVRSLRRLGKTYSEILRLFKISKSTLSVWCKDLPKPDHLYFKNRNQWLTEIRKISSRVIRDKREKEVEEIARRVMQEVTLWNFLGSRSVQKALLSLLYWAEGQKLPLRGASVAFVNTDPRLALLFLTLLRNCYQLDETKLRVRLHLHWYHDKERMKLFWSKLLGVDQSQFGKIYVKRRSKTKRFRKNFAGICFIRYYSVDLRWEIVYTAYNIQEAITGKIQNERP